MSKDVVHYACFHTFVFICVSHSRLVALFSFCVCIVGFGQGSAHSCGGGVYGMCSGTAVGGPLGWGDVSQGVRCIVNWGMVCN